jgi:hypothetical protein
VPDSRRRSSSPSSAPPSSTVTFRQERHAIVRARPAEVHLRVGARAQVVLACVARAGS